MGHVPQVAVVQLGARMHYAVPVLLERSGMLAHFYTDAYGGKGWMRLAGSIIPGKLRPAPLRRLLGRRCSLPQSKVTAFTVFGLEYNRRQRRARSRSESIGVHLWAGDAFDGLVCRAGLRNATAVYSFNGASAALFRYCRDRGVGCIVEQTSAPYSEVERIWAAEAARWPGWEICRQNSNARALADREAEEWKLADAIICASRYVADILTERGVDAPKCRVIPYGIDTDAWKVRKVSRNSGQSIRVLFVGGVRLLKGVQYLIQAAHTLGRTADVRLVGPVLCNKRKVAETVPSNVEIIGHVPRTDMRRHFEWADVFCLPSLCDGFGIVCLEAMAAGVPVVITPNTGASELITDGREGFVVPVRDSEAIVERIEALARDRGLLEEMSHSAYLRAKEFGWESYRERLVGELLSLL